MNQQEGVDLLLLEALQDSFPLAGWTGDRLVHVAHEAVVKTEEDVPDAMDTESKEMNEQYILAHGCLMLPEMSR